MPQERHYGHMHSGRLKASTFAAAVREFPEGTPLEFTVRKAIDRRSSPQNRYYWGVVVPAIHKGLRDGGMEITRQGTHDLLKFRFLKEEHPVGKDGEFVTLIPSTSDLDVEQFIAYTDACIRFAAEYLNTRIPGPGEQGELEIAA